MSIYGPLMIGLNGTSLMPFEWGDYASWQLINGYLLFKKNFSSAKQLSTLTQSVQNRRQDLGLPPALLAVDHEGGQVQRFVSPHFTPIPSAAAIGQLHAAEPEAALELIQAIAVISAAELGSCGINLLLGPVLDLNNALLASKERSYSTNPNTIIELLQSFLGELKKHGMNTIGKHYPGLGAAGVDPHLLPTDMAITLKEMEKSHLLPFQSLLASHDLSGVMLTHGAFPLIDSTPIPRSSFWIETMLRTKYQFDGVVMTDCLHMLAAQSLGATYTNRIIHCMPLCDIIVLSHVFFAMKKIIDKLQSTAAFNEVDREKSQQRIAHLQAQTKPLAYYQELIESQTYCNAKRIVENCNEKKQHFFLKGNNSIPNTTKNRFKKHLKNHVRWILKRPYVRELAHKIYFYMVLTLKKLQVF